MSISSKRATYVLLYFQTNSQYLGYPMGGAKGPLHIL